MSNQVSNEKMVGSVSFLLSSDDFVCVCACE